MSLESSPIDRWRQILRAIIGLDPDGLQEHASSKAAKPLSYRALELLKGWRKVWAAALCRRSQAGCKAGERRAISASGIVFTFLHISRKPLIIKEICSAIAIYIFFTGKSVIRRRNAGFVSIKGLNALIVS
ncbi:hypothetical protein V6W80_22875 [Pseudomonas benzopyrenica]|uniref:Uncharacterized protein n=1 Tax=Pseudomonas benzopyrenica TaxID=2993566 RepID=A0ABZ2FNW6_9PSED